MKYIGPKSKKGLNIKGKLWQKPWDWNADQITANITKEPSLSKFFAKEDKPKK